MKDQKKELNCSEETKKVWNSLETTKIVISIFSTLITIVLTVGIFIYGKKINTEDWKNQKLISKKIELYDSIMPRLNIILCYMNHFGSYKEYSPIEIIKLKRELNIIYYTNRDFFSTDFQNEYVKFIDTLCFEAYTGKWDSQIKNDFNYSMHGYINAHSKDDWDLSWNEMFTGEVPKSGEISKSYYNLMKYLAKEIGVK